MIQLFVPLLLSPFKYKKISFSVVSKSLISLLKEPALCHRTYHIQALTEKNTLILICHLITHDTYTLVFNVESAGDTVDLSVVPVFSEPLTVYNYFKCAF